MRFLDTAETGVVCRHTQRCWHGTEKIQLSLMQSHLTSRFFQNTDLPSEVYEMPHTQSAEQFKFVFLDNAVKNGSLNNEFCLQARS